MTAAVGRLGLSWPIVFDNDQSIWTSYANRYWPTLYLMDSQGCIRYRHAGEGEYAQTEQAIQRLLMSINPTINMPSTMDALSPEDESGAVCYQTTPELDSHALGNPNPLAATPSLFEETKDRIDGRFYLQGWWKSSPDGATQTSDSGRITLPYHAASVSGVFAASPDPSGMLPEPLMVFIHQDKSTLSKTHSTPDLQLSNGIAHLQVDSARSYALAKNADVEPGELELRISGAGFTIYAFSFGRCVVQPTS